MASRRRRRQPHPGSGRTWHDLTQSRVAPRVYFTEPVEPVFIPSPFVSRAEVLPRGLYGPFVSGVVSRAPRAAAAFRRDERLQFRFPGRVVECLKRKVRKEVLHALGIAGRRGLKGRGGSYRRGAFSGVSC